MSQRLGMADGRCFSVYTSSKLFNDYLMSQAGIPYEDNYSYRQFIQRNGSEMMSTVQQLQSTVPAPNPNNYVNQCQACDRPLLKVPNTY